MTRTGTSNRVTLRDVAGVVGVSPKTVSNVVNSQGWVSETVRQQVLAAIDELGYRPNLAARQLRKGSSGIVALVVPSLREPYFAEFASSFVSAAQERSLTVLVSQSDGDRDEEIKAIEGHSLPGLDGIVLSPLALTMNDLEQRKSKAPLILIGENGESLRGPGRVHIGIDNVKAARAATEHLLKNGRRRIAVIGHQEDQTQATSRLRMVGYRQALEEAGVPFDPDLVGTVDKFNRAEASRAIRSLIESGTEFDGLFCFSDSMAFGAIHSLSALGVKIPEEVAVVGFDNIEEGRHSYPVFDTIDPGADHASQLILDALKTGASASGIEAGVSTEADGLPEHLEVPFRVVAR